MKTVIVANPRAGAGRVGQQWQRYSQAIGATFGPAEVRFTQGLGDATALTRAAVKGGFDRVVVVGGDGTLNECVNGLFSPDGEEYLGGDAALVVYPAGSGGDFSRSIGLDGASLPGALDGATSRLVDVGRARFVGSDGQPQCRYFINIGSFGLSGLVAARVNAGHGNRALGGTLSFLAGTLRALAAYRSQHVRLTIDDVFDRELKISAVAVANGQFFGGAMHIAPQARVADGLFDVIVMENIDILTFLRYSRSLYRGRHIGLPGIAQWRGRTVRAEPLGRTPVLIDLDGEQPGQLPVTYDVVPRRIKVYAPWEHALAS